VSCCHFLSLRTFGWLCHFTPQPHTHQGQSHSPLMPGNTHSQTYTLTRTHTHTHTQTDTHTHTETLKTTCTYLPDFQGPVEHAHTHTHTHSHITLGYEGPL